MSYFQNRGTVFTFSPDGGQNRSDQLYNDWEDLYADTQGVAGEKTIVFDNVGNAAIVSGDIPAGTYDMDKITLAGPSGGSRQTVSIGTGVSFPNMLRLVRNLIFEFSSSAAPLCLIDSAVTAMFLTVEDNVLVQANSSRPVWQFDSNVTYNFNVNGQCRIGSPATFNDTIKTNGSGGGVILNLYFDGGSFIIPSPVLEGNATDTLNVTLRDTLSSVPDFSAEGFGTVTVTDASESSRYSYDNAVSGITGENVQDALDDLALREEFDTSVDVTFTGNNLTIDNDANNAVSISLDSGFDATQSANLVFRDQGVNKWAWIKNGSNDFILQDSAASTIPIRVQTHADNDDAIYINSGNVGIGTAPDPSTGLHVLAANTRFESETNASVSVEGATGSASIINFDQNNTTEWSIRSDGATNFVLKNGANDNIIGIINGVTTEAIRIDSAGEVGINNVTPNRQLDVTGTGRFSGNVEIGTSANGQPSLTFNRDGTDEWLLYSDTTNGDFYIAGLVESVFPFRIEADAINGLLTLHASGLGINDTTPTRSLDVTGTGHFTGLLEADGGIDISGARVNSLGVTSTGTNLTVTTEDMVACTAGSITITLPAVASAGVGRSITIKDRNGNAGSGDITIDGNASETIDGATTHVMNIDYQSVTVVNDGSTWMIV